MKIYLPLPAAVVDAVVVDSGARVRGVSPTGVVLFDLVVSHSATPWVTCGRVNGLVVELLEAVVPPYNVFVVIDDTVAHLVVVDLFASVIKGSDLVAYAELVAP